MPGRRWSDGLHQAVEAKEKVKIERENQTLATITFQNYFRMYKKLGGHDRHGRDGSGRVRQDLQARSHRRSPRTGRSSASRTRTSSTGRSARSSTPWSRRSRSSTSSGRPVLVGTISIEKSEHLATLLKRQGIPHVVLNAKYHEREAEIVAQAGRFGAVTIATNMAGRGTDIILGGNPRSRASRVSRSRAATVAEGRSVHRYAECCTATTEGRSSRPRRRTGTSARQCTRGRATHEEVVVARRPAHPRHRAARVAPHRQPAARPRRPPGRPRLVALLPLARRRPHAHLRRATASAA